MIGKSFFSRTSKNQGISICFRYTRYHTTLRTSVGCMQAHACMPCPSCPTPCLNMPPMTWGTHDTPYWFHHNSFNSSFYQLYLHKADLQLVYLSRPNSGGAYTPGTGLLVIGFIQSHFFILHPLAHWKFLSFHCATRIFYTVHDYTQWKLVDGVNGISKHHPPSQWILYK